LDAELAGLAHPRRFIVCSTPLELGFLSYPRYIFFFLIDPIKLKEARYRFFLLEKRQASR
ncbi:MAG: hypothetical protein SVU32_03165, partial [Candidatus Nanohaloarchaea archaeon]|nr:hypothetical protein [Candidatus Nanohaloarchaea archaeon]